MVAYIFAWLFVFVVPWENVVVFPGLGTISKLLGLLAFGATGLHVLLRGRFRKLVAFHWVGFAYLCWVLFSVLWAVNTSCHPEFGCALEITVKTYLQLFVMVWILWEVTPTRPRLLGLLQAYVLGAYVAAIITIYNYAIGAALQHAYGRFAASGFDPNDLGMLMALALPMAWCIASSSPSSLQRWVNRGYFVAGTLAILLTGSRGAMLATMAALFVVPWTLTQVRRGVRIAAVVIMLGAGFAAARFVPTMLFQRLSTTTEEISEGTLNNRLQIWEKGIAAVPERPLQGYGPSGWEVGVSGRKGSHNTYLSVLVEEGLIGLFLYLSMIAVVARRVLALPVFERRVSLTLLATLLIAMTPLEWDVKKAAWMTLALLVAGSDVLGPARLAADPGIIRGLRYRPASRPSRRSASPVAVE